MDMQKIPPIQQKRIITFVNYFIVDTVSFLNSFMNASESSLWKLEKRMRKLEATIKLLEVKLNFIPDTEEGESVSVAPESKSEGTPGETTIVTEKIKVTEEKAAEDAPKTEATPEVPEEVQKFVKMIKVGVPVEAVKLKMRNEGLDPALLRLE